MWKRTALKKKAKQTLKSNYWRIISVCFLCAMLTSSYTASTTFIERYAPDAQVASSNDASTAVGATNSEVIAETVDQINVAPKSPALTSEPLHTITNALINMYTSGKSVVFSFLKVFNSIMVDHSYWFSVLLSMGALTALLYQFFIANIILIGERRFFLEVRNYPQTRISKLFFLYKLRFIRNPVWIMFCRTVFQWMWNLTIVGGFIKYYEYSMIPFILAENPAISRKDAFLLSKRLMHGNKWKFFVLHVTFIGWHLLSLLTFGIFDFAFVNPYVTGTDAELYMELRKAYILSRHPGYEALNDSMLDRVPSEDELLISKALYDDSEGPYTKISYFSPQQYPVFLYSIQPPVKAVWNPTKADQDYGFLSSISLIFFFTTFCWIVEGCMLLIREGILPAQSFSLGPSILLYMLSAIVLVVYIKRFTKRPIMSFIMMTATYSVLQYSLQFLFALLQNGSTVFNAIHFAMLGATFLYYLAPRWDLYFQKLPKRLRILLCILFCVILLTIFVEKGF